MVLGVLGYWLVTTTATWVVGRPLIARLAARNASEATLRYELTRIRENAENIVLINGDNDERQNLNGTLSDVVSRWLGVVVRESRMTWLSNANIVLMLNL